MSPIRPRTSAAFGRRTLLGAGGAAGLAAVLAACTTGSSSDAGSSSSGGSGSADSGSFPRTVKHVYGETTIEKQPTKVATISWVNPDNVLSLGVVPVGMDAVTYGGNANKTTDWIDARISELKGKTPTLYSATDGIDTNGIAASTPDVIIAAYSGLSQEQYDSLSKIAPTIAYPAGDMAWGTKWQDSLKLTAQALGKEKEAETVIKDVESKLSDFAAKNASLKDTTFLYGTIDPSAAEQISLYTDIDNRSRFLEELGMKQADVVVQNQPKDQFYMTWSPEKADQLQSDILISWFNDQAAVQAVQSDALLSKIPAIAKGTYVAQSDQQQVLSLSASSALSLPWALEHTMTPIVQAATKAKGQ